MARTVIKLSINCTFLDKIVLYRTISIAHVLYLNYHIRLIKIICLVLQT